MRNLIISIALLGMAVFSVCTANAATINAATCSLTDVQNAVNTAANGDTVAVPAGSCSWSNTVSWTNKNISVIGAGIGNTIITANSGAFSISATTQPFRISGFTLTWSSQVDIITFDTTNTSTPLSGWRIDNVRFQGTAQTSSHAIMDKGINYGLVDHCTFDGGGSYLGVHVQGYTQSDYNNYTPYLPGRESWAIPTNLGTDQAVYVEDSVFNFVAAGLPFVNDMSYGARMVFRHNTVTAGIFQSHSAKSGDRGGGLKYEIYNNTWVGNGFLRVSLIRSGTGVIFNNTISGYTSNNFDVDDQRAATEGGCSATGAPLNACNGSGPYDGNVEGNGWPCIDQIGRGAGVAAGAAQSSIPLYAWNNGTTSTCATGGACNDASVVQINGACSSAVSWIKPTTHSNGQVDYVNNGSTSKPGYIAYTYPHPLSSGGTPAAPAITSTLAVNGTVGTPFTYPITASGSPTSFDATGLPAGLSVNTSTGVISGTPAAAATSNVSISATNATGTGTATLNLTITLASPARFIFLQNDVPAIVNSTDTNSAELGVKFTSSAAGKITGFRFYKGSQNTGAHTGHLWSTAGALLASATFTNETASGWQQVNLTTPVNITAGTTYVASYHSSGHYSGTLNYFDTAHVSGPLTAPSSSSSGGNGIYVYSSATAFPTKTYNALNYWADVVFVPTQTMALLPTITSPLTATGMVGVPFSYTITATNNPTSFNATGLPGGPPINTLSIDAATGVISGTPTAAATTSATLSATNAAGTGTATLNLTISAAPPTITSANASSTVGAPFSYTITASNNPTSFSATGLPTGLSINVATGVISGTPPTIGTSNVTISATNSGGVGTATVVFNINGCM